MKVSWDDEIPKYWGKEKMLQTTNQVLNHEYQIDKFESKDCSCKTPNSDCQLLVFLPVAACLDNMELLKTLKHLAMIWTLRYTQSGVGL